MPCKQYRFWAVTCGIDVWAVPQTPPQRVRYIRGQQEIGEGTGYHHWQLAFHTDKLTETAARRLIPSAHWEPMKCKEYEDYVWKEATAVPGTQFELGTRVMNRNSKTDWAMVRADAMSGNFANIPDDVFIRCYSNIKKVKLDYEKPSARGPVDIRLFLGPSGTGKTHAAFGAFGTEESYVKTPTTKWWDGYQGESKVIVDEFRGQVSVGLLLKWLDPAGYPLSLETKGGGCVAKYNEVILTSNIHPREWYPDLDGTTLEALYRRIKIIEFNEVFVPQ
ncbi:MAG: helicase [Zuhalvirus cruti]|uniref:Replication-associated protein n=1 Tax=Cressdnaviricota sp. TaxID=2748378 RepID=A0A3G2YT98_9VIRU|nr:MAG: helicase [Cressdnaviricota sp.]